MCVLYANYTGIPTLEELQRGEERNADGGGVAWVENGKVFWEKGLDAKEMHTILLKVKLPNMAHFRLASIGAPIPPLTHPFPLTPKVPLFLKGSAEGGVLMHNGTLGDWKKLLSEASMKSNRKIPGGDWSDTRALAWLVANFGEGILTARDMDLVFGQKIAILFPDGQLKRWGALWPAKAEEGKGYIQSSPTYGYKKGKTIYPSSGGSVHQYGVGIGDWPDYSGGATATPIKENFPIKVPVLGRGTGYHFNPAHERRLEPLKYPSPGSTTVETPATKVTVITSVEKKPGTDLVVVPTKVGQVIFSKPELEKVMASLSEHQEKLAKNKMNIITFPRKGTSH